MARLCRESGVTRSTIHHYMNIGLLHRPRRIGLNLHVFDGTHVNRLRQIRRLREKEGLPLVQIKELLARLEPGETPESASEIRPGESQEPDTPRGERNRGARGRDRGNRERILDAAILLFSARGYENTKISDVTDALHMGKGTFYVYFKNKKELFMECIDRLTVTIVPREAWAEIRREEDFGRKMHKRGVAFLNAFPGFRGILNLLRVALGSNDPALAEKAREAFKVLSAPMAKDLRRAISQGVVRQDLDVSLLAFLQLVLAEGLGYWLMMDSGRSIEEGLDFLIDIFGQGLAPGSPSLRRTAERQSASGGLEDRKGMRFRLEHILLDGKPFLRGRMGDAVVDLDLAKTQRVLIVPEGATLLARAVMKDGGEIDLKTDGQCVLTAESAFGPLEIFLKEVASISFVEP